VRNRPTARFLFRSYRALGIPAQGRNTPVVTRQTRCFRSYMSLRSAPKCIATEGSPTGQAGVCLDDAGKAHRRRSMPCANSVPGSRPESQPHHHGLCKEKTAARRRHVSGHRQQCGRRGLSATVRGAAHDYEASLEEGLRPRSEKQAPSRLTAAEFAAIPVRSHLLGADVESRRDDPGCCERRAAVRQAADSERPASRRLRRCSIPPGGGGTRHS